jgi:hypothetical protein
MVSPGRSGPAKSTALKHAHPRQMRIGVSGPRGVVIQQMVESARAIQHTNTQLSQHSIITHRHTCRACLLKRPYPGDSPVWHPRYPQSLKEVSIPWRRGRTSTGSLYPNNLTRGGNRKSNQGNNEVDWARVSRASARQGRHHQSSWNRFPQRRTNKQRTPNYTLPGTNPIARTRKNEVVEPVGVRNAA